MTRLVQGVSMSHAAAHNVEESGIDVQADVRALRAGLISRAALITDCLEGADDDRVDGWLDYVSAVCAPGPAYSSDRVIRGLDPSFVAAADRALHGEEFR